MGTKLRVDATGQDLWEWLKASSEEEIAAVILQYIRISRMTSDLGRKKRRETWRITDLRGEELVTVPVPSSAVVGKYNHAQLVAKALVKKMSCASCGQRLLVGEDVDCGLCEAKHAMSLVRMMQKLTTDVDT